MAGTTANLALRYPTGGDSPSFAVDMKHLADDTDAAITAITALTAQYRKVNPTSLSGATKVGFGTVDGVNTLTGYASPTFTAPAAGRYEVSGCLMFSGSAGIIQATVYLNGAARNYLQGLGGTAPTSLQIPPVRLNLGAGDTVEIYANAAATGSSITVTTGYENWLLIKKVG